MRTLSVQLYLRHKCQLKFCVWKKLDWESKFEIKFWLWIVNHNWIAIRIEQSSNTIQQYPGYGRELDLTVIVIYLYDCIFMRVYFCESSLSIDQIYWWKAGIYFINICAILCELTKREVYFLLTVFCSHEK